MDDQLGELERALKANPADHGLRAELIRVYSRLDRPAEANTHIVHPHYAQSVYSQIDIPPVWAKTDPRKEFWMQPQHSRVRAFAKDGTLSVLLEVAPYCNPTELSRSLNEMSLLLPLFEHAFGKGKETTNGYGDASFLWKQHFCSDATLRTFSQICNYLEENYLQV